MRFLELFLLCCLLRESPPLSHEEKAESKQNPLHVACCGRAPDFHLRRKGEEVSLRAWLVELAEDLQALAAVLDADESEPAYQESLKPLWEAIDDPAHTPSAKILAEMRESGLSFQEYALKLSKQHAEVFRARPLPSDKAAELKHQAKESLADQRLTEASNTLEFDEYLRQYFAQIK